MPSPSDEVAEVELVMVLLEMFRLLIVPDQLVRSIPCRLTEVIEFPVIVTVPLRLFSVKLAEALKAIPDSSAAPGAAVPVFEMEPFVNVKFVTPVPFTPPAPVSLMVNELNDGLSVLVSDTPWLVVFWIVPPVTARLPEEPVLLSTMPLAGPDAAVPAETLANFRPPTPIVVFATLRPIPVVVVIVLAVFVAVTVPPPVAVKASLPPVVRLRRPEKLIVELVLLFRKIPVPVSVMAPLKAAVSAVRFCTTTERPAELVI